MAKKLAIFFLLILYGWTGSVAASAAHDHCDHQGPKPTLVQTLSPIFDVAHHRANCPANGQAVNQCDGCCHLSSVARLDGGFVLDLRRLHGPELVVTSFYRRAVRAPEVPTPPPNLV